MRLEAVGMRHQAVGSCAGLIKEGLLDSWPLRSFARTRHLAFGIFSS